MTQEEAQAYLIRARDAPRDIAMLDTESQWVQDGIARLRKMQMRDEFAPRHSQLKALCAEHRPQTKDRAICAEACERID